MPTNEFVQSLSPTGYVSYERDRKAREFAAECNATDVLEMLKSLRRLDANDQNALRLSTDRANSSWTEASLVDRAIDIGIALESLLLHNSSSQGEVQFRLSIRGASLLNTQGENPIQNYKLLRRVYDFRSAAVHTGNVRSKKGEDIGKMLDEGVGVWSQLSRKIVQLGRFPDWETEYVLRGRSV